jgi:hypothetical protein
MADRPTGNRRHHNSNRSGRWGKYRVLYLLRPGEIGTWAKRTGERLSPRLTIFGLLLQ